MAYPTENLHSTFSDPHGPDRGLDEVLKRPNSVLIVDAPDELTLVASA